MPLPPEELRALQRVDHTRLWRIIVFLALYGIAATGTVVLIGEGVTWWACIPLYLLSAASLHGISLFTHEGVHGALASHPMLNRLLAAVCAWPVLQNFAAYKVLHLRHHANLGRPGDPDHYPNYASWPPIIWLMHWGRLLVGYPVYITAIPLLGWRQGTWRDRGWIVSELGATVGLVAVALHVVPSAWLLHAWLLPMAFINTMVNIRGMSQHTLLDDAEHAIRGSRSIECNALVRFFMCNENFHLEHHLYPRVPWYNLPHVHARLRAELATERAPFIPSYAAFVGEFLAATLERLTRNRA